MAEKLERKVMEIYGENAATRDIIAYGSDIAGNIVETKDPDVIQTEAYKTGVRSAVVGNNSTTLQNRQALDFLFSRQLKYLYQQGIAEWKDTETYYNGSFVSGGNGKIYFSKVDDNIGNDLEDKTKWEEFTSGGGGLPIGAVYYSGFSTATQNPGALPLFTGETISNAEEIYPEFYAAILADTGLQCTSEEYENALSTYGECPKYVVINSTPTRYKWENLRTGTLYTLSRNPTVGDLAYDVTGNDSWPITEASSTEIVVPTFDNKPLSYVEEVAGTSASLRLPKLSNYIKAANTSEGITQKEAGLPNITGYLASIDTNGRWGLIANASADDYNKSSGAFRAQNNGTYVQSVSTGKGVASGDLYFDASRSSAVYGKSSTVTPAHTTLYPWVVAYAAAVPASTAQAAEFQQGLSGKADTNLGNVPSNYDYVVESRVYADGSWYRKYKSGWVEQGGQYRTTTTQRQTWGVVTFIKPFTDTNYTVQAVAHSPYRDTTRLVYMGMASIGNKTTTKVDVGVYSISDVDKNNGFDWIACGQGAN